VTERYLPKWAQDEMQTKDRLISVLGERVAEVEAALAGDGQSLMSVGRPTDIDALRLPSSARDMYIKLPNGFEVNVYPASEGNGGLGTKDTIQLQIVSHHTMNITPQSSNTIHIGGREL
jgi:hypothetical protein